MSDNYQDFRNYIEALEVMKASRDYLVNLVELGSDDPALLSMIARLEAAIQLSERVREKWGNP